MTKKRKSTSRPFLLKFTVVMAIAGAIGFGLYQGLAYFLINTEYFKIKSVVPDPSLAFINKRDISKFIGQNIFFVDLKEAQTRLSFKYPQVAELNITKQFPSQITISAKNRAPFAQTELGNKIITLDDKGMILSSTSDLNPQLPFISDLMSPAGTVSVGQPLRGRDITIALQLIAAFDHDLGLKNYQIKKIDAENLSKIQVILDNDILIFFDQDEIDEQVRMLSVLFSQGQLDIATIKYIDLRFKEPILGKK